MSTISQIEWHVITEGVLCEKYTSYLLASADYERTKRMNPSDVVKLVMVATNVTVIDETKGEA
jgi:hypothetical protein